MSEIGRELQLLLQAAYRESLTRRHAYLTVEHLLYALLHDERGCEILRHSGARLDPLKAALDKFFNEDLETVPGEEPFQAQQTLAFHRVLQHAVTHCESAEKEEVDSGDLLAALFQEPDSFAVNLLRSQGVSRLDLLQYIAHGVSKFSGSHGEEPARPAGIESGIGDAAEVPSDPIAAFSTNLSEIGRAHV